MKKTIVNSIIATVNATLCKSMYSVMIQDKHNNVYSVEDFNTHDDIDARNVCVYFNSVQNVKQVRCSIYTTKMTFNKLLSYATTFVDADFKKSKDNFYTVKDFSLDVLESVLIALQIAQFKRLEDVKTDALIYVEDVASATQKAVESVKNA